MNNNSKKKVIATTAALALLVTGTFAWQSFSQRITNETAGVDGNVGMRLHNDFNGQNADVYVENYASEGGTIAYTRVRLHEYMEIGNGAGYLSADESLLTSSKDTVVLTGYEPTGETITIDNPNSWDIYLYDGEPDAQDSITEYITLTHGDIDASNQGAKIYMPTFNKDFEDVTSDIKGTLLGSTEDRYDGVSYDDYVSYTVGEQVTGNATYSMLSNEANENGSNIIEETHTAKNTETATIMTMDEWIDAERPIGDYWVFDTDGWAYWANGVYPQSATGLLVDSVNLLRTPDNNYHYGLHVVSESYTGNDWGIEGGEDTELGVYAEGITEKGEALIEYVVDNVEGTSYVIDSVTIALPDSLSVVYGNDIQLTATVVTSETYADAKDIFWTVVEKPEEEATSITEEEDEEEEDLISGSLINGLFTPNLEMRGLTYTITATSVHDETVSDSVDIEVEIPVSTGPSAEGTLPADLVSTIQGITIGSTTSVEIDGAHWYVIGRETMTNEEGEEFQGAWLFMDRSLQVDGEYATYQFQVVALPGYEWASWKASSLRWEMASRLADYPTIAAAAQSVETTTDTYTESGKPHVSTKDESSYDKFFPLTEPRVEAGDLDYLVKYSNGGNTERTWMLDAWKQDSPNVMDFDGQFTKIVFPIHSFEVRPSVWVNLGE